MHRFYLNFLQYFAACTLHVNVKHEGHKVQLILTRPVHKAQYVCCFYDDANVILQAVVKNQKNFSNTHDCGHDSSEICKVPSNACCTICSEHHSMNFPHAVRQEIWVHGALFDKRCTLTMFNWSEPFNSHNYHQMQLPLAGCAITTRVRPTAVDFYFLARIWAYSRGFPRRIYVSFLLSSFN